MSVLRPVGQGPQGAILGLSRIRSPLKLSQSLGGGQAAISTLSRPTGPAGLRGSGRTVFLRRPLVRLVCRPGPARRHIWSFARLVPLKTFPESKWWPGRYFYTFPNRPARLGSQSLETSPSHPAGGGIYGLVLNPKRVNLGRYAAGSRAGWEGKIVAPLAAPLTPRCTTR